MEKQPGLTDWELNNLLYDVASSLDERVFTDIKCLCTGEGGIGRGDLERLETPFKFFLHLRQMDMISKDNFLLLQALLSKVHRDDLREKAHHLAQIRGNILHFHKPKTNVEAINKGFQRVRLHVQGSFETYKRPSLEELRKYVAKLLSVKEEFILICGVELEDGGSLILTFLIQKDYAKKLPQLFLEHSQEFSSRNVHNIHVDIHIPKEFDHNQGLSNAPNSLVRSHDMCAREGHENSSSHGMNKDLHLLIIGKTGVGKSSTGNSILGRKAFKSHPSMSSVTQHCHRDVAELEDGRKIYVVDTPGAYDTHYSEEEGEMLFVNEIKDAIAMNPLGYHAILLALRFGTRFYQEDTNVLLYLKKLFGENFIEKHCIVVMTHGDLYKMEDELLNVPFIDWCKRQKNTDFINLLEEVSGRVILFDNKAIINEKAIQRQKLVEMVDRLVINGGRYTNEHFERARQKMEKTLKDKRENILSDELKDETSLILAQLVQLQTKDWSKDIDAKINALTVLKFRSKIQLDNIKVEEGTPLLLKMQQIIQDAHDKIEQEIHILTLTKELEERRLMDEKRASKSNQELEQTVNLHEATCPREVEALSNKFLSLRDENNDSLLEIVSHSAVWPFKAIGEWFK